ncbi:L-threonylcarbamoyladenylate synthase [Lysinibacter sp. HNR]|uniref:L-threonylcarbamoyladenylate synthase n=1 Tax=Lysinibacter sp. HNR TaxID=3031408 RepID=UPI0024356DCE|nr:L-threonylcarbamoyladenylate synthase [Lysinibacter sp. HNR]WGD36618.1 L-threonylcarbamoyladenylate synthase [Lysinibacter sp. HNR]
MATVFDCSVSAELLAGMRHARGAIGRGELVVLPTDTVYGIAADAFSPVAVQRLLDAKGRTRQSPPPVLIANTDMLAALTDSVPAPVRTLVETFWPGPLTIILQAQASLRWDLGDTNGSVAVRMPDNPIALELLAETGPLAVSSANLTGQEAATSAAEAERMLADAVAVYLDAGERESSGIASTIIDARAITDDGGELVVLRQGGITPEQLAAAIPTVTVS